MTKDEIEEFLEYQDFIQCQLLYRLGISINLFTSRKYQYNVGESISGIEIKNDKRMKDTGNLYIETEERHQKDKPFVKSSIMREDNTFLWCIGDYERAYLISKEQLQVLCIKADKYKLKKVETDTSKGVLIPVKYLKKHHIIIKELIFGGTNENRNTAFMQK